MSERETQLQDALVSLLGAYQQRLQDRGETRDIFTAKAIRALDSRLSVDGGMDGRDTDGEAPASKAERIGLAVAFILGLAAGAILFL